MSEQKPPGGDPKPGSTTGGKAKTSRADVDAISALQEAPAPPPPPGDDPPNSSSHPDRPSPPTRAQPTTGQDRGDGTQLLPPLDDESPLPLPDITAKHALDDDERSRRNLLMFIMGGSVAAVILLIIAGVLFLKPSDSSLSSTPTTTPSSASLTLVPAGPIPDGTTVTAKITLISTQSFRSAIVTVDGQKVAQTSSATEPLSFTPPNGQHTAVGRVTLQNGEEVLTPPVEFTVGAAGTTSATGPRPTVPSPSTTASTAAVPATTASTTPTTAPLGPIDPAGLSALGAKPMRFGDPLSVASSVFPGEAPDSKCAPIAPTFTGGRPFTYFGFPGQKFSYFLTQDPTMSTVEGAKVGMPAEQVKQLIPGMAEKTNAAGIPLLVQKSSDGSSELVFFLADNRVLFIAGSTGDLAESQQC